MSSYVEKREMFCSGLDRRSLEHILIPDTVRGRDCEEYDTCQMAVEKRVHPDDNEGFRCPTTAAFVAASTQTPTIYSMIRT